MQEGKREDEVRKLGSSEVWKLGSQEVREVRRKIGRYDETGGGGPRLPCV